MRKCPNCDSTRAKTVEGNRFQRKCVECGYEWGATDVPQPAEGKIKEDTSQQIERESNCSARSFCQ